MFRIVWFELLQFFLPYLKWVSLNCSGENGASSLVITSSLNCCLVDETNFTLL